MLPGIPTVILLHFLCQLHVYLLTLPAAARFLACHYAIPSSQCNPTEDSLTVYMFHICSVMNINTCVTDQHMHTNKICFIGMHLLVFV